MKQFVHKILVLCMIAVLGGGIYFADAQSSVQAASGGRIYITPSSAGYTVGQEFNALVRVSSPSPINAAFVNLYYNGRGLQVLSIQRGADFPNQNTTTKHTPGAEGKIYMESTRNTTTAGDFHFATIRFKATAAGSWGFRPGTESKIINYPKNNVSFTVGRADFAVSNPVVTPPVTPPVVPPVTPPVTPPTKPTTPTKPTAPKSTTPTTPTPSKPRTPSGGSSRSTPEDPGESPTSETGLQLTDFTITNLRYRGASLSWNTTKPTPSKINFGTNPDDLSTEQISAEATTQHTMEIDAQKLRAGTAYYIRVTADDGSGPVTVDSEFTTKPIAVVIKVTDKDEAPVVDATITVDEIIQNTDENGETTLELPEGDVTIFAQKDELSQETDATVTLPEGDDTPIQRVSLALTEQSAAPKVTAVTAKKTSPAILLILLPIILAGGGFVAFMIWRKKRQNNYYSDPLSVENYVAPVLPSTSTPLPEPVTPIMPQPAPFPQQPEPQFQPLEASSPEHHTTLPEMVGRYGITEQPVPIAKPLENISPTGQQIPQHTSLKDLVVVPQTEAAVDTNATPVSTADLPTSPVHFDTNEQIPEVSHGHHNSSADGSLTINH